MNRRRSARLGTALIAAIGAAGFLVSPTHATFSGPNGRIVFASDLRPGPVITSSGPGALETDVHTIEPDGTDRVKLTSTPGPDGIGAWAPDGSKIAFVSSRDGNSEVYVMNADGTDAQRLTVGAAADTQPRWSPDGARLVFVSARTGNLEIFTMDADGGDVEQLTNHSAADNWPEFSPDGSRIAFTSTRSGGSAVYTMNSDGSGVTKLTADAVEAGQPDWSPDGGRLVFVNNHCSPCLPGRPLSDLFVLTLSSGETRQVTRLFGNNLNPSWSPDGAQIAFWHAPSNPGVNNTDVYVIDVDGTNVRNVTKTPTLREYVPDWGTFSG